MTSPLRRARCLVLALCLGAALAPVRAQAPTEAPPSPALASPAPPPVPPAPGELIPFLVGTSHPELPRPEPQPSQIRALRARIIAYLESPRRPGLQQVRDLADKVADVVQARGLGYWDAAYVVRQIQLSLDSNKLTNREIHEQIKDFRGRFADTPITNKQQRELLRGVREVLGSAKNELP